MQMRSVSWPTQGDQTTFRRRALLLGATASLLVIVPLVVATMIEPALLRPVLPLAAGMGMLAALWIHDTARASARRAELERSFAGLVVLHLGEAYQVADRPVLGSYASRRHAASAALDRGSWAIVVQAWDRCWLLDARPVASRATSTRPPVSFRSRAVADVIPAIRSEAIA